MLYACGNNTSRTTSTTKESNRETSKETSKSQNPQVLNGKGTKTQFVNLNEGLAIFEIYYKGSGHFSVQLKKSDGDDLELLANQIGSWDGSLSVKIPADGKYIIDVDSQGSWVIGIR